MRDLKILRRTLACVFIINDNNPIFLYFSKMYLELMESGIDDLYDHTDCMKVGRKVMENLYSMADMELLIFSIKTNRDNR